MRMRAVIERLLLNQIPNHLMAVLELVLTATDVYPVTAFGIVFQDKLVEIGVGL